MDGDFFLALAEKETREDDGAVFYRTVRGRYVRETDVVRGEELGRDGWRLPLAFVYGEDRALLNLQGSKPSHRQGGEARTIRRQEGAHQGRSGLRFGRERRGPA